MKCDVVLDDRLLEYSYRLTDLLSIFHMSLTNPTGWTIEQLDRKSRDLLDHTNLLIEIVDKGSYKENSDFASLGILSPLIGLLKKLSKPSVTLKKSDEEYYLAWSSFDLAVEKVAHFIEALTCYFKNEGKLNFRCYIS
jgi:hypothetical protein